MKGHLHLSRRTVLKGLGASLALPWLEAMTPLTAVAREAAAKRPPRRMAFFYVPNGVHMQEWKPQQEGRDFSLPSILEPLQPFKDSASSTGDPLKIRSRSALMSVDSTLTSASFATNAPNRHRFTS